MMKRNLLLGIVLAVCSLGIVKGQTVSDSLAIVSAQWKINPKYLVEADGDKVKYTLFLQTGSHSTPR